MRIWQQIWNYSWLNFMWSWAQFFNFGSRVGLKAVVLEQSDKLRSEGTTIGLFNNGMRILELFDLADQFRNIYFNNSKYVLVSDKCFIIVGLWLLDVNFSDQLSLKRVQFVFLTNSSNYCCRIEYLNQYGTRLTIMDLSHCEGG
jgi:hypothetical protein